jgi:uncharacterized protein (TIGR02271 family)
MLNKSIFGKKTWFLKSIITFAIVGGILGAVAGFLYKINILAIPGAGYIIKSSPVDGIITGTVLGIFIGACINSLIGLYIIRNKTLNNDPYLSPSKLQLREERLDISKRRVETGEVTMHKEVFKEEKNIVVPVTREEIVIEKKILEKDARNKNNELTETIRIPVSEESIEVIKHPIIKEDIAVYRQLLQETKHIEEVLKKEKIHIKTTGDPEIKNKET